VEFLELLGAEDRRALESIGAVASAPRGRVLIAKGDLADKILVLYDGRVKLVAGEAVLGFRGPGALLGEVALVDGGARSADVVALEPVEYLVVAASAFRAYLERRPAVPIAMLSILTGRLRDSDRRLAQFASADTLGRLCARLVQLCEEHGESQGSGSVQVTLPITQEDLAAWTGASIEATAKALRALRKLGWITTGRKEIVVHELDRMRERAP
jgi:CRP-like cAMP-binding protein